MSPYAVLGVPEDADAATIQVAYERRLAELSRLGAFKLAEELVAAHGLLTDRRKRELYDRHGVTSVLARQHPLQRYAPPAAVPFRQWSPAEGAARVAPADCVGRRQRSAVLVLGAMVALSLLGSAAAAILSSSADLPSTPTAPVPCEVEEGLPC